MSEWQKPIKEQLVDERKRIMSNLPVELHEEFERRVIDLASRNAGRAIGKDAREAVAWWRSQLLTIADEIQFPEPVF